jgi:hypothetical protein
MTIANDDPLQGIDRLTAPLERVPILGAEFAGNALGAWLLALLAAALVFASLRLLQSWLVARPRKLRERPSTTPW